MQQTNTTDYIFRCILSLFKWLTWIEMADAINTIQPWQTVIHVQFTWRMKLQIYEPWHVISNNVVF